MRSSANSSADQGGGKRRGEEGLTRSLNDRGFLFAVGIALVVLSLALPIPSHVS
jgi:hypothetical protein